MTRRVVIKETPKRPIETLEKLQRSTVQVEESVKSCFTLVFYKEYFKTKQIHHKAIGQKLQSLDLQKSKQKKNTHTAVISAKWASLLLSFLFLDLFATCRFDKMLRKKERKKDSSAKHCVCEFMH